MNRLVLALAVAPLALTLHSAPAGADSTTTGDRAAAPRQVFDVSDLDTGAAPRLAWAERTSASRVTIHGPDGTTPAAGDVRTFAPMGSGYVVQTGGARPPTVRWIAADGTPGRGEWRSGYGLAVSAGGEAVAFTGRRGRVRVIDSEGDRVLRMPSVPGRRGLNSPAVVFGEDCQESATSNGCAVMVNSTRRNVSWVTSSHGIVDRTQFQTVSTGRGRWLGGIVSRTDTGTCNTMRRGVRTAWTTCRNLLSVISPDKRHLVGTPAYADGFGPTRLDLLDLRSGDRVRSWTPDRRGRSATYFDQVWEDADHLLVVTFQAGEWAIVRLGTDGSMEYAVTPRADGGSMESPFLLQKG
ncbi:hypothetical protein [Nocardioides sp. Soil805]|uniref:hypothetical protein n=1 Tax=Nocardioides sp. Soil805 TaxID=1736416 RepID=UPI000703B226|nr:hypothetical protein [Nocardioides sp. Soil805]KRF35316.1 hypothetical protein ASG94_14540 [Nocardioides sp. Soil805]